MSAVFSRVSAASVVLPLAADVSPTLFPSITVKRSHDGMGVGGGAGGGATVAGRKKKIKVCLARNPHRALPGIELQRTPLIF